MIDNNLLFKIHNISILKEILDDVPYHILLKLSERNKKLQNLLNLDLKIYENLSKRKYYISSICEFLDLNTSYRQNPQDIILKIFFAPFIAFKHLKLSYGNKIESIYKISQRNNSFILCGEKQMFYLNFDNKTGKINLNEILSESKQSIMHSKYPTEINEMKYLFKSNSILYGIDLSIENKLIAKELYTNSENQEYDLILKLTNTSFIIGTIQGDCYYFTLDYVSFQVSLRIKISEKQIYNFIKVNNETIICSSLNTIYTINCINGKTIYENCEDEKDNEIISLSLNTKNNILASGTINGTLTLYSINLNGFLEMIVKKENLHDYPIFQIIPLTNGNFCSCSDDNKLILIDVNNYKETEVNFQHCVRCVIELNKDNLMVSSLDNKITILNKVNGKINVIFENLFSVPKNIFKCDDSSLLIHKFNGDVDIMGIDLNKLDKQFSIDNLSIIHYDINDEY